MSERLPYPVLDAVHQHWTDGEFLFQLTRGRKLKRSAHTHDFYEIICVLEGKCAHEVNGTCFDAGPGAVFLLTPGDGHSFLSQEDGTNVLALSIMPGEMRNWIVAYHYPSDEEQKDGMQKIRTLQLTDEQREHLAATAGTISVSIRERLPLLRVILGTFLAYFAEQEVSSASGTEEEITQLLPEMSMPEHVREGIPALMRITNYSHSQLCRIFSAKLNMTPNEYITELRMREGYRLVTTTNMSYDEVAARCGFGSLSHFYRLFRARFGTTPGEVRFSPHENINTV